MGIIFIVLLFLSFTILDFILIHRWHRWWRVGAVLPGLALLGVVLNIVISTTLRDRTSHNLWPLEIAVWSAAGLAYLGILSLVRNIVLRHSS